VRKAKHERPITTRELAEWLDVTERTIANWRKTNRIPFWQINSRNVRYTLSAVEKALMAPRE
jgi:excisionase family DNA binding protein